MPVQHVYIWIDTGNDNPSKIVFQPRLAFVLEAKPCRAFSIMHHQNPVIRLYMLGDLISYLNSRFLSHD